MQKSCNNEADQNRLFCQKLRRAAEGEITNKWGQISSPKKLYCSDIPCLISLILTTTTPNPLYSSLHTQPRPRTTILAPDH